MAQEQPMDFINKFIMNMIGNDMSIYQEESPFANTNVGFNRGSQLYGRLPIEQFGGLSQKQQSQYINYMQQAPNAAFAKLWPEIIRSPHGQGISKEIIDLLLRPYLEVQQTGLPQGY
ncbi:MAG: hypothetical protein WC773_04530 [Patescibacteria group bacterium]|jgi:hypothetical protein